MFRKLTAIAVSALYLVASPVDAKPAAPAARVAQCVYQINVAIEVRLADGKFAQLAAISPRKHYPVFITTDQNQGYRVIGQGSCFPARALKTDKTYLLTNKHVVDFGEGMAQECERFFAAMRLYAERSAGFANPDQRYKDLQRIVNFAVKKNVSDTERTMYQATVDTIWDMYDDHLSNRNDPSRKEFNRCLAKTGVRTAVGYFVHLPGPASQPPVVAQLYKQAHHQNEPDLAILSVNKAVPMLELESAPAQPGQTVQAVGYPALTASGKTQQRTTFAPSFNNGKVVRVQTMQIHFDATVSNGGSGGPLINQSGRVLGIVARRAMPEVSSDRHARAISVTAVKSFAPELFGAVRR